MSEVIRKSNRKGWLLVLVFTIAWTGIIYYLGPRLGAPGNFGEQTIRYPANFDWPLSDLNGQPIRFDKFKGKPIFLNIWATWCGPCIAEMPSIARLAANPNLKGKVEFICVATDSSVTPVRQYLEGKGWPMTFLHAEALPTSLQTEGIPATFAISPEGIIVGVVEGSSDWDNPEVVKFLEKLAEPNAAVTKK